MLNIIKANIPEHRQDVLENLGKMPLMDIIPAYEAIMDSLILDLRRTRITSFQVARYYFGDVITDNQVMLASTLDDKYADTFINLVKKKIYPQTIAIIRLRGWKHSDFGFIKVLP